MAMSRSWFRVWGAGSAAVKQTAAATLAAKADGYGFCGVRVDGMDPLAMYQTTREAVERAATGGGPTLIEMHTYRFAPHSTYDGTPVYRTSDEEALWRARDPIARMRTFLAHKGLWEADQEDEMRRRLSADLERWPRSSSRGSCTPPSTSSSATWAASGGATGDI